MSRLPLYGTHQPESIERPPQTKQQFFVLLLYTAFATSITTAKKNVAKKKRTCRKMAFGADSMGGQRANPSQTRVSVRDDSIGAPLSHQKFIPS